MAVNAYSNPDHTEITGSASVRGNLSLGGSIYLDGPCSIFVKGVEVLRIDESGNVSIKGAITSDSSFEGENASAGAGKAGK